jgi:molybdenum cofactor synthesis domain-containing protein
MLAIGDELLSGRTQDRNIHYLAQFLTTVGIDLREVRIVPDEQTEIVAAVNDLRIRYRYLFTSGGIGPTHDDITADAIAAAFEVAIGYDPRAMAVLDEHYRSRDIEFSEARKRMARVPDGAALIDNPVSAAPGFRLGNVIVMAGVPEIFQAMLNKIAPDLETGRITQAATVDCPYPEGTIGMALAEIQRNHPDTVIGSYPRFDGQRYGVQIVIRSHDPVRITAARHDVEAMLRELVESHEAAGDDD